MRDEVRAQQPAMSSKKQRRLDKYIVGVCHGSTASCMLTAA